MNQGELKRLLKKNGCSKLREGKRHEIWFSNATGMKFEAYENAEDALCLMLYDMEECGEKIPQASRPADIKTKGDAFVSIVPCDTLDYRRQYDNKAVKKTLTIPSWLNTMAEREGINFSATLQDALKQQLRL